MGLITARNSRPDKVSSTHSISQLLTASSYSYSSLGETYVMRKPDKPCSTILTPPRPDHRHTVICRPSQEDGLVSQGENDGVDVVERDSECEAEVSSDLGNHIQKSAGTVHKHHQP